MSKQVEVPAEAIEFMARHLASEKGQGHWALVEDKEPYRRAANAHLETALPAIYKHFSDRLLSDEVVEKVARLQYGDFSYDGKHYSFDFLDGEDRQSALDDARRTLEAALKATSTPEVDRG